MKPDQSPAPDKGQTRPAQQESDDGLVPRTPNEHDTSADSQSDDHPQDNAVGKAAHQDIAEGKQDTGRSPAMDETYEKQKQG